MTILCVMGMAFGMASAAVALPITTATTPQWSGSVPHNPDAGDIATIVEYEGTLEDLYKQDVGGPESGSFAASYDTAFSNTPTDPEDATITYQSGEEYITGDPLYLLVKDGNHDPIWYIFDITDWNGTEPILIEDFWVDGGAISHVSIYGPTAVPEPGTLLLFGFGLLGVAGIRRRLTH